MPGISSSESLPDESMCLSPPLEEKFEFVLNIGDVKSFLGKFSSLVKLFVHLIFEGLHRVGFLLVLNLVPHQKLNRSLIVR